MSVRMHARMGPSASCIEPVRGCEEHDDDARDSDDVRGAVLNGPPNSPGPGNDDETTVRALDDG